MALTPEQETALRRPFQPYEHGFVNNRPYIRKDAIRRRLSTVDSGWSISPPQVVAQVNDVVVLTAALTVGDVPRFDVGTGIIQTTGRDNKSELPPYEIARNTVRAFKTAASDLLPRCAIQFGVGEYLKDVPKKVVDERTLADWLAVIDPKHWALNGGGQRFNARMKELDVDWPTVAGNLEPGRAIHKLSDTTLSFDDAVARLETIAAQLRS